MEKWAFLLEDFSIFFERKEKILKGKGLPNILDFIDMIKAKKVHFRSIWAKFGLKTKEKYEEGAFVKVSNRHKRKSVK